MICLNFFSTVAAYALTFLHLKRIYQKSFRGQYLYVFSILCSLPSIIWAMSQLCWKAVMFWAFSGLISLGYAIPIRGKTLRNIPSLKIFLIALVWSCMIAGIPLENNDMLSASSKFFLSVSIFLYVLGLTVPFDIRDIDNDPPSLRSLPQCWGIKRSKCFAVICLLCSGTLLWNYPEALPPAKWAYITTICVATGLIAWASPKRKNWYYTLLIEGCSLLPWILMKFFIFFSLRESTI
ncbi:MAG: hypothetical protein ACMUEL_05565 [Flavobacteriales bacterium Tduv]